LGPQGNHQTGSEHTTFLILHAVNQAIRCHSRLALAIRIVPGKRMVWNHSAVKLTTRRSTSLCNRLAVLPKCENSSYVALAFAFQTFLRPPRLARWPAESEPVIETLDALESPSDHMNLPKPVTSCTNCRAAGYSIQLANGRCGRVISGGKRCKGTTQSAIGDNDWVECPSCATTGWEGANRCSRCDGAGWLFTGSALG